MVQDVILILGMCACPFQATSQRLHNPYALGPQLFSILYASSRMFIGN